MALILERIRYEEFLINLIDTSQPSPFVSDEKGIYQVTLNQNRNQLELIDNSDILHVLEVDMHQFKKDYSSYFREHGSKNESRTERIRGKAPNQKVRPIKNASKDEHINLLVRYTIDDAISFAKQYTRNFNKDQLIVNDRQEILGVICNNIFYVNFDALIRLAERNNIKYHFKPFSNIYQHATHWEQYLLHDGKHNPIITEKIQIDDELVKSSYYKYDSDSRPTIDALPLDLSKV